MYKDAIAMPCTVNGSCTSTFSYMMFYSAFVGCSVSLIASRISEPETGMCGSQVTNTKTLPDPILLEPYNCNRDHRFRNPLYFLK
jgi:hypothetical protein